jgi:ferredoxin-NADP reductase
VTDIVDLTTSIKLYSLKVAEPIHFRPGQWVDLFIPGDLVGGFSIVSPPSMLDLDAQTLQLAIKFSKHPPALWMHEQAKVGSELSLRVGGDWYYDVETDCKEFQAKTSATPSTKKQKKYDSSAHVVQRQRHVLLIAGGIGVGPLQSMLEGEKQI